MPPSGWSTESRWMTPRGATSGRRPRRWGSLGPSSTRRSALSPAERARVPAPPASRKPTPLARLANDNLHPPVLRLADTRAGRHQKMGLAESLYRDSAAGHAVLDQFRGHCLGPTNGQRLIVFRGAGRIGIAVDLNPCVLNPGRVVRGVLDDLTRAI